MKFNFLLIIFILFLHGCNATNEDSSVLTNFSSESSEVQQGEMPYRDGSELVPGIASSFAEDIKFYDIITLEEAAAMQQEEGSEEVPQQAMIRKSYSEDDGDERSDEGDDKSDEDDNSDEDDEKQDDADGEKDDAQDDDDDDSDDDSSDDSDDDSGSDDDSSTQSSSASTNITLDDYTILGSYKVVLNSKTYKFVVAFDNYKKIPNFSPYIIQNEDGSYTLFVNGYVIEDNQVYYDKGVFTLQVTLPSLNTSGYFPITSNILTNSAENQPVLGYVTISSEDNNIREFRVGIAVEQFTVLNRTKTYGFKANFDLGFSTSGIAN